MHVVKWLGWAILSAGLSCVAACGGDDSDGTGQDGGGAGGTLNAGGAGGAADSGKDGTSGAAGMAGSKPDASTDAGQDAKADSAQDAKADTADSAAQDSHADSADSAGQDAPADSADGAIDAAADRGIDGTTDAPADVSVEAGTDAGAEAAVDAGADTGAEAAVDSGPGMDGGDAADGAAGDGAAMSQMAALLNAHSPACLACANSKTACRLLLQNFNCDDLAGNAAAGPAVGQPKAGLCLQLLTCELTSNCAGVADGTSACYCGNVGDTCFTAGGSGQCKTQEESALETTTPSLIEGNFSSDALAGGRANSLVQCLSDNYCTSCF